MDEFPGQASLANPNLAAQHYELGLASRGALDAAN
jgi:hypothetical protein